MHIFNDNDGVIHDEANRYHHRQQGQQVDGEPHHPDQKQDANQRQGNGDNRNGDDAQGAQEQEDHQDNNDRCLHQGAGHFLQCFADVLRKIGVQEDFKVSWQLPLQFLDLGMDTGRRLKRVGIRRWLDSNKNSFFAAGVDCEIVSRTRQLNVCDITEGDALVAFLAHHDAGEFCRVLNIGLCIDAGPDQLTPCCARCRNEVVTADRSIDVGRGDAESRHLGWIEPDTVGEESAPQQACLADAVDRVQHWQNRA